MTGFVPLHQHTHFSLLDGVSKPKQIAKRCVELGYHAAAMTDHGNVGCAVQFVSAMNDVCECGHMKGEHGDSGGCKNCDCNKFAKYKIKPIIGCELYITPKDPKIKDKDNHKLSHLPVLAKNLEGWKRLISINSFANHKDHFYYHPRIDLPTLSDMSGGNLIGFSGHPGSDLANVIFHDASAAYNEQNYVTVREDHVRKDWKKVLYNEVNRHIDAFGKDNFFLETQNLDPEHNPAGLIAALAIRYISQKHKFPRIATADSHYPTKANASDQRVLLCSAMKTTQKEIQRKIERGEDFHFRSNFLGDYYHIPSLEEMQVWHDEEELANTLLVADMCDEYDIRHAPVLPIYPCPNDMPPDVYINKLCKAGWQSKIYDKVDESRWPEYTDRVRRELQVIKEAGLASYFLIVQDYCNWARRQGMIVGPGRGSGAGCLVSYLIGITTVDPIQYGLLFERFYNAGRNAPGHISLPDIDCDFPVLRRKEIVAYLKYKFGHDKVANIATFNSMKGRSAITEVLRTYDIPFDEVKRITSNMPKEAMITEELQAMADRGDEPSSIRYALENDPEAFRDWVVMDEKGSCTGVLGKHFEQAMRLEGTKKNISTHAAGVVLASTPLSELCPLVYDEEEDVYVAGMEYPDLESMGQVKLDILGVAAIDKVMGFRELLRHGYIDKKDADDD